MPNSKPEVCPASRQAIMPMATRRATVVTCPMCAHTWIMNPDGVTTTYVPTHNEARSTFAQMARW